MNIYLNSRSEILNTAGWKSLKCARDIVGTSVRYRFLRAIETPNIRLHLAMNLYAITRSELGQRRELLRATRPPVILLINPSQQPAEN